MVNIGFFPPLTLWGYHIKTKMSPKNLSDIL